MEHKLVKLEIFIPEGYMDKLRDALASVDAGHIGNYDRALSYSPVKSEWRPLEGANPFIGEKGRLSMESELKVEVTIKGERLDETIRAIREAHPYEEPVINAIALL